MAHWTFEVLSKATCIAKFEMDDNYKAKFDAIDIAEHLLDMYPDEAHYYVRSYKDGQFYWGTKVRGC